MFNGRPLKIRRCLSGWKFLISWIFALIISIVADCLTSSVNIDREHPSIQNFIKIFIFADELTSHSLLIVIVVKLDSSLKNNQKIYSDRICWNCQLKSIQNQLFIWFYLSFIILWTFSWNSSSNERPNVVNCCFILSNESVDCFSIKSSMWFNSRFQSFDAILIEICAASNISLNFKLCWGLAKKL